MIKKLLSTTAIVIALAATPALADLKIGSIVELSGPGAAAGTNFRDGVHMGFEEINAAGGILGEKVDILEYDSQTDPQVSRALVQKAIDEGVYAITGTVYSSSTVVNMMVAAKAGIPQFTGSEAPSITATGNPYIFRTAFGSQKGIPKLAKYMADVMGVKKVGVAWANTEFGKGGYKAFMEAMQVAGIEVVADVASEQGQTDFSADVLKLKHSDADAFFIYYTEEESARFLREARKQGLDKPLLGDTTLVGNKVIELAGEAANGAMGHVGLTPDADIPAMKDMVERFKTQYKYTPDHNAIKGYIAAWTIKYVTEMVGSADSEAIAKKLHGLTLKASEYPGVLMDVSWDEKGEMSRESFFVKVDNGKQVVESILPAN
ncbi:MULTISPECIES: ABC transporter substrate-binding protein [Alphaproteobacteria]|uniref:ABC transporter substrate-binding protein n=2 Tax=Alphaproteobacteria TaxID=28211 RepID=A0A512HH90_9HYPH|nr:MULTISPECIES: ABC transporter substrate-binding protein [Alphaproteobacteria]GEO84814.1 ABC transporter substrate-binding protein [Ciceribacter naphthalenivorans]GLR20565.1 ABC transporter substrate-binding protein [Ciceribacter naphthalenivorans]GLT03421.1 ABC transporter substrate-binding protein [Sphingomonas psychrolutea]